MNKIEMLHELNKTFNILLEELSAIRSEQINLVPFEGSWTAGQLAQHVIMSGSGFQELMNGPVKPTERNPTEMADGIQRDFLNFNIKMASPDFIVPPVYKYDKATLLTILEKIKEDLQRSVTNLDLSQTCTAFELPVVGFLTRYEAATFVIYHTQRHIHQLKKIHSHLHQSITS